MCMCVVCNLAPGPSVLGSPDPRSTDRLRVKSQHPKTYENKHTHREDKDTLLRKLTLWKGMTVCRG